MPAEIQKHYIFSNSLEVDSADMDKTKQIWHNILSVFVFAAGFLFNRRTLKNKVCALALTVCALPLLLLEGDATALVFMLIFAIPMFFAKENWIFGGRHEG